MVSIIKAVNPSQHIEGVVSIELDTFRESRGQIWTVYAEEMTDYRFVSDKVTISHLGVLRGFHGDPHTAKLITCLSGQVQLGVVDLRKDSKTYGKSESYIVNDSLPQVIIVPEGCANAHLCLSDKCIFFYKWSKPYDGPDTQMTVAWNDPDIDFDWVIANPIVSDRDRVGRPLKGAFL